MNLHDCTTPEDFFEEGDPSLVTPWSQYDCARYGEVSRPRTGESDGEMADQAFAKLRRHRPVGFSLALAYSYGDHLSAEALMLYVAKVESHGVIKTEPASTGMAKRGTLGNRHSVWTKDEREEVVHMYLSGTSTAEIAVVFGKRKEQVYGVLRDWRKTLPKNSDKKKWVRIDFERLEDVCKLQVSNDEKANLLGISKTLFQDRQYKLRKKKGKVHDGRVWVPELKEKAIELHRSGMSNRMIGIVVGRTMDQVQTMIYNDRYRAKKMAQAVSAR